MIMSAPVRQPRPTRRRTKLLVATAASALLLAPIGLAQSAAVAAPIGDSGFAKPYSGPARYLPYAPTQATNARQVNQPLGRERADQIAKDLGFDTTKVFSKKQYRDFINARGYRGISTKAEAVEAAKLSRLSVSYLTNTTANPIYRMIDGKRTEVLIGSYGLIVNKNGMLESPANPTSPVRQINWVLAPQAVCDFPNAVPPEGIPCGYMGDWMRKNGAKDTLAALYRSAYTPEVPYGSKSQTSQDPWVLAPNRKGTTRTHVGMAMAPSIWIVNFLLIYALNPDEAAKMPAYWEPVPAEVAKAIRATPKDSPTAGQVPYSDYMEYFTR